MPVTLSSAAEEHTQALRAQLLESTELAAKTMIGQTRAEGERRIEMAGRQAQAIAETVSAVEHAEQALAERAKAFAEASRALRSELKAFAETLSESEERIAPQATDEPDLRLVEAPAAKAQHHQPPSGIGQILLAGEVEELDEVGEDEGDDDNRPEEEFDDEDDDEDEPDDEPDDEEDEEPPSPEQIARYFREAEESELAREARHEREVQGKPGIGERLRNFFSGPLEAEVDEEEEAEVEAPAVKRTPAAEAERNPKRERLYTDIGGAVIGLGGAAALLNFVLLK
ncbi:MAG: hypothetical protein QOI31_510 [Solirubrobacterales bacterium]|jgi:hypothetical protein|nr:hypothetical protein [Solirubrobacterales bacterium]